MPFACLFEDQKYISSFHSILFHFILCSKPANVSKNKISTFMIIMQWSMDAHPHTCICKAHTGKRQFVEKVVLSRNVFLFSNLFIYKLFAATEKIHWGYTRITHLKTKNANYPSYRRTVISDKQLILHSLAGQSFRP